MLRADAVAGGTDDAADITLDPGCTDYLFCADHEHIRECLTPCWLLEEQRMSARAALEWSGRCDG